LGGISWCGGWGDRGSLAGDGGGAKHFVGGLGGWQLWESGMAPSRAGGVVVGLEGRGVGDFSRVPWGGVGGFVGWVEAGASGCCAPQWWGVPFGGWGSGDGERGVGGGLGLLDWDFGRGERVVSIL